MKTELAFKNLYEASFKALYRYFYYHGVQKSNIEDLIQDTYILFLSKYPDKVEDLLLSKKILYRIAHNKFLESLRTPKEIANQDLIDRTEEKNFEIDLLFMIYEDEEKLSSLRKKLQQGIEQLKGNVKSVIQLRYLENKTRSEVSNILKISEDMVHTYQKRGVTYLKKFCE